MLALAVWLDSARPALLMLVRMIELLHYNCALAKKTFMLHYIDVQAHEDCCTVVRWACAAI
jgi:hypothetical protein